MDRVRLFFGLLGLLSSINLIVSNPDLDAKLIGALTIPIFAMYAHKAYSKLKLK